MNRTTTVKEGSINRKWYVVDATGMPVGRLASQVSQVLRGKSKPQFAYNADCGDFVVIVNADKVVLTDVKDPGPGGMRPGCRCRPGTHQARGRAVTRCTGTGEQRAGGVAG